MPPLWQILLIPVALVVSALLCEGDIWLIYGYVTFREGKFTRLSFRLLRTGAIILTVASLLAPWVVLIVWGLVPALWAWFAGSLAVFILLHLVGRFVEWRVRWFFDVDRDRRALREVAARKEKMFTLMIEDWPSLGTGDRRKFLQHYISFPLHMREVFFVRLLDSFPVVDAPSENLTRLSAMRMKHWAGAHLFNNIEALLEMRHRLTDEGIFAGKLPIPPTSEDHPEALGDVHLARIGEDLFAIGPAA